MFKLKFEKKVQNNPAHDLHLTRHIQTNLRTQTDTHKQEDNLIKIMKTTQCTNNNITIV